MTALAELDDEVFSADAYALPVPKIDEHRATKLNIRFSGSGILDRTRKMTSRYSRRCGSVARCA